MHQTEFFVKLCNVGLQSLVVAALLLAQPRR